jgi:hypothetical protein
MGLNACGCRTDIIETHTCLALRAFCSSGFLTDGIRATRSITPKVLAGFDRETFEIRTRCCDAQICTGQMSPVRGPPH